MSAFGKSPLSAAIKWIAFKRLLEEVAGDAFKRYYDESKRNKMSKKYLYRVRVTVSQTFAVLAENEGAARAMAMDDDAWHHLEDIGTEGGISADIEGSATLAEIIPWVGVYKDKWIKCRICHAQLEYGTGNDYTCDCEEAPND